MREKTIYLLNSPVLPNHGTFKFMLMDHNDAIRMLRTNSSVSAIGHEATAKMLSKLWAMDIPVNRTQIHMDIGDQAIIFRLQTRLPEGMVLNEYELSKISYELGLLERVD